MHLICSHSIFENWLGQRFMEKMFLLVYKSLYHKIHIQS